MKKQIDFKILYLEPKDLKEGDLVLSTDKLASYIVLEWEKTYIHEHTILKIFYVSGYSKGEKDTLLLSEMCNEKRKVVRTVNQNAKT